MFSLYATGNYSTSALADKMYELGLRSRGGSKVVKSRVHELLSDPFYYGKFMWKDMLYKGSHKPLITKDLFYKVQLKLSGGRAKPYYNKYLTELRGKIFCGECGKTVTWERQKGHWYGGCKQCKAQLHKKKQYIRQETLEERLLANTASVAPKNDRILDILKKALSKATTRGKLPHFTTSARLVGRFSTA